MFFNELNDFLKDYAEFKFNQSAAAIGTQGPDIFFFHKLLNPIKTKNKVGVALHNAKPAEIMEAFAEYCKFSPNKDIAKSYIYGFILHYSLDRICHPFVFSFQERLQAKNPKEHRSTIHNRIEINLDTYLLSKRLGLDKPTDFDAASTITLENDVIEEIGHILAFVVPRVTDQMVSEKEVVDAIKDTNKIQNVSRDKNGKIKPFVKVLETILAPLSGNFKFSVMIKPNDLERAEKYANLKHIEWKNPNDESIICNKSFVELFDDAKEDAKRLIQGFDALQQGFLNGYELTKNISFLTGIEVK